jgi:hypothetical protein
MNLLAFTEGPNHVCYRYRLEAFGPALAEHGWELHAVPLARSAIKRAGQLRRAAAADLVVLQRKLLPFWQLRILRMAARRLIYDFDDAIYCRDSYHPKGTASWQRTIGFWATVYCADAVTAGNQHLRTQAARFTPSQRVHFVPTCVRPDAYPLAVHRRRGSDLKLVWIGQRSTLGSLCLAESCLAAAAAICPGMTLRVISDVFPDLNGIRIERRTWSAASEAGELAEADVGISWLPDDAWSLGKCGLKVLQYMAAGLPVVANPVGANCEMVLDGVTGFLVRSPSEFAEAIGRLAADPALRARLGRAGQQRIEQDYSVGRWGQRWALLCNELSGCGTAQHRGPHFSSANRETSRSFAEARP